jgi:hypothetical protein
VKISQRRPVSASVFPLFPLLFSKLRIWKCKSSGKLRFVGEEGFLPSPPRALNI